MYDLLLLPWALGMCGYRQALGVRSATVPSGEGFPMGRNPARWRVCVPRRTLGRNILAESHGHASAAHTGIDKTRCGVRSLSWWPKTDQGIEAFVRSCRQCARGKVTRLWCGGFCNRHCLPFFLERRSVWILFILCKDYLELGGLRRCRKRSSPP